MNTLETLKSDLEHLTKYPAPPDVTSHISIWNKDILAKELVNRGYEKTNVWSTADNPPDPDMYDWVLTNVEFVEDGSYGVPQIAEYRDGRWHIFGSEFSIEELKLRVTHWRPIPQLIK